jgi:hypothetical protein
MLEQTRKRRELFPVDLESCAAQNVVANDVTVASAHKAVVAGRLCISCSAEHQATYPKNVNRSRLHSADLLVYNRYHTSL